MRTEGIKAIRQAMESYIRLLKEGQKFKVKNLEKNFILKFYFKEYSQGLILPTKDKDVSTNLSTVKQATKSSIPTAVETNKLSQSINSQIKIQTKKLQMAEEFKCRANEIYNVFTDINVNRIKFKVLVNT